MKRRYISFLAGSVLAIGMLAGCGKQTVAEEGEKIDIVLESTGKAIAGTTDAAGESEDAAAEEEIAAETVETPEDREEADSDIVEEESEKAETTAAEESKTEETVATEESEKTETAEAGEGNTKEVNEALSLTVSNKNMQINEDGNYELLYDFDGFSGKLTGADQVTKFTMKVFDKNGTLIYETDIAPKENWSTKDFAFIRGVDRFVFEAKSGTESCSAELRINCRDNYNFDKLTLDLGDTDGDGLYNYLESYFGTNEKLTDTDGDGLTDYQELYTLGYDALSRDSDGDGIPDGDEDEDKDGISNKAEYDGGTDPIRYDAAGSNSSVGQNSNPSGNGSNSAVFSVDSMRGGYDKAVIPSVSVTGDQKAINSFSISLVTNNVYINRTMVGYMGNGYDLWANGNITDMELTFTYDEKYIDSDMLQAADFCPAIYYMDMDTGWLDEVKNQTRNGVSVTAHINRLGIYVLANKTDLEAFWNR